MTHLDQLNKLPSPIREEAIENNSQEYLKDNAYSTLRQAIQYGFNWYDSPQGYDYWLVVFNRIESGEFDDPSVTLTREDWGYILVNLQTSDSNILKEIANTIQSQLGK